MVFGKNLCHESVAAVKVCPVRQHVELKLWGAGLGVLLESSSLRCRVVTQKPADASSTRQNIDLMNQIYITHN